MGLELQQPLSAQWNSIRTLLTLASLQLHTVSTIHRRWARGSLQLRSWEETSTLSEKHLKNFQTGLVVQMQMQLKLR